MANKYEALFKNQMWKLVPLPKCKNIVGCKWVYKTKYGANREIVKNKARLVTKGFF